MTGGHVISQDDLKEPPRIIVFDKYAFDLDSFEQRTSEEMDLKPRERYYSELVNPGPDSRLYKRNPGQFTAELHERFATPLYPLAFVMIALAAVGNAQSTRQNRARNLVAGFAAAAGIRLAGLGLDNVISMKPDLTPLVYVLPVGAILCALIVILRSGRRQRAGPGMFEKFSDAVAGLIAGRTRRLSGNPQADAAGGP